MAAAVGEPTRAEATGERHNVKQWILNMTVTEKT